MRKLFTNKKRRKVILALIGMILLGAAFSYFLLLKFVRVPTGSMSNTILPGDRLIVSRFAGDISRGEIVIFKYPPDPSFQYVSRIIGLPGESIEMRDNKVYINGRELPERRVYVQPSGPMQTAPLETVREDDSSQEAMWTVYYYQKDENFPFSFINESEMRGVGQPFKIPVQGDQIPQEILSHPALKLAYDADNDGRYDSNQYFCMGDNRDNSEDSRFWGTVPQRHISGKPLLIYWSVEPSLSDEGKTRWGRIFSRSK